ncbi:hypothetical protein ACOCEA_05130 [Maribacter sp. CXY002]|uniref:hypothetical protein n=1 Tax=Maribacter luteocoastalis TaxID=3407671 RepID=UPI003B67F8B2
MRRKYFKFYSILLIHFLISSCTVQQTKYQQEYNRIWKEMIQTQAWKESIISVPKQQDTIPTLYASLDNEVLVNSTTNDVIVNVGFDEKYQSLVSRAYFKIITEAEKFDARITAEYELTHGTKKEVKVNKKLKEEITKKYKAHKAMLEGLKSWNIFSDDRSGDLMYFKAENKDEILKMMGNGDSNDQLVNFLIYKLADLYHVEEN